MDDLSAIRAYGPVDMGNFRGAYQRYMTGQRGASNYAKYLYVNGRPTDMPYWVKMDGCKYLSTEEFLRTVAGALEAAAFNASGMPLKRRRMWENSL